MQTGTEGEPEHPGAGLRDTSGADQSPEDAAIAWIAARLERAGGKAPLGQLWIGDDAAVLGSADGAVVLATDAAVAGVHADLSLVSPADLGWKALASTLSDVGAMGARPLCALVALCVPTGADPREPMEGVAEASAEWGCPVVGGDLSTASEHVVAVTVAGLLEGERPAVTRGGARPGDRLVLTGPLGGSAAGLRLLRDGSDGQGGAGALIDAHRRPRARLVEGRLARVAGAAAMIDVSDGFSLDMHRLADASGVGFVLEAVPAAPGATTEEAIGGGEDYELVIATADVEGLARAFAETGLRPPLEIGACTRDVAERRLGREPLPRSGWQHAVG